MPKIINISFVLLFLAACGGGGGGNNADIRTDEFLTNYGLDTINADAIYAAGGSGAGRVVAVFDTGIHTGHPEFADRIHPASKNFNPLRPASPSGTDPTSPEYKELDDPGYLAGHDDPKFIGHYCGIDCGHGTWVSSVIASAKDGIEMHGVAYNAQILMLKSDFIDPDNNNEPYPPGLPAAVDHAIANNVDAINISAGGREFSEYDMAIRTEKIIVGDVEEMMNGQKMMVRKYIREKLNTPESLSINAGAISLALAKATREDIAIVFATGNSSSRGLTPERRKELGIEGMEFEPTEYPTTLAGAKFSDCDGGEKQERLGGFCNMDVRRKLEAIAGYNADEGPFNGLLIGVASVGRRVDANNFNPREVSVFSSLCDTINPRYCLAAPGAEIRVAFPNGAYSAEETRENPRTKMEETRIIDSVDGTSFAAPHVVGAIALLRSTFPVLSSKQAVRIILETADDVIPCAAHVSAFDCFNDDYGNGILNLRAALRPARGFLSLSPPREPERFGTLEHAWTQESLTLAASVLSLPAAFGDALGQGNTSGDLSKVVAYDNYARAYVINLAPRVNRQGFEVRMDSLLSFDSFEQEAGQTSLTLGRFNLTTQFSMGQNDRGATPADDTEQNSLTSLHFSADLGGANIGFATGGSSRPTTLSFYGEALQVLGITQATPSPYAHLVQNGAGFTIDSHLKDWAISYGLRQGDGANKSASNALAFDVKAERSFDSGIYLGGLVSVIAEQNSFLAASGRGVFDGSSGTTQSLTLGMGYASGHTRIFGQLSGGQTKISLANGGTGAILSNFSAIKTSAALVGMSQEKIFSREDRFDIVLSRPLKVSSASATLNADVSGAGGLIASGTSRVSLAPSGQQTNLELTYTNAFSKTTTLSLGLALINQPAHNAAAKNEHALALRWIKHF